MRNRLLFARVARASLALPLAACALAACTKKETPPTSAPVDAAFSDVRVAAVNDAAPPPARLTEGSHDYRGTVATTAVSMHLGKLGLKVSGAYVYDRIGKPIGLEGAIGEDGTIALDEFVGDRFGKVTGHLTLHLEGRNLVGTWTDLARKKTLPITLAPSAPTTALYIDAGTAPGPNRQAEQCVEDLACPAAEAERLFLAAADAPNDFFDCSRFLDGVGVKKDPVRGRACFERTAGKEKCDGSSPDPAMGELASLRIDGTGGPRDIAGARKLLENCFEDVTVQALRERADLVAANPSTPPVDFCKDIGGTTLVGNECTGRTTQHERDRSNLLAKTIAAGLDEKGRPLFRAASKAFSEYVSREAALILFQYAGGSIRYILSAGRSIELEQEHGADLVAFGTFNAPTVSAEELAQAEAARAKACVDTTPADSPTDDAELREQAKSTRQAFVEDQRAWAAYRDAEVVFYTHVYGKAQGASKVRDAVLMRLLPRRTKVCTPDEH